MDLILAIVSGAGAIVGAVLVKVIADDAKEWTPWVTRHLLDGAVRRLPEGQRERYAEEWAAHLAEVPGVVGKLAVALQFQIAAFGVRELDAKARLDAWQNERAAVLAGIQAMVGEVLALVEARAPIDEANKDVLDEHIRTMRGALIDVVRRCDDIDARRPALGITVVSATHIADRTFSMARARIVTTLTKTRNWRMSLRDGILRTLRRFDE